VAKSNKGKDGSSPKPARFFDEVGESRKKPRKHGWTPANRLPEVIDKYGHRRKILLFLGGQDKPIWGETAAELLGLTPEQWWQAIDNCRWFHFETGGWTLTIHGRDEIERDKAESDE
jgi:hypothetical protein